jgi:hypothetical protein
MSVPRPAIFVATVTAPTTPARAMIAASRSCCLAFNTSWATPLRFSIADSSSDFSTLTVPTKTGWPLRGAREYLGQLLQIFRFQICKSNLIDLCVAYSYWLGLELHLICRSA